MNTDKHKQAFRIISLNVNGLNQDKKRREIFRYIRTKKPDMVMLQETFSSQEQ